MANTIRIKRSAVSGKVPTTGDLDLGELAINTFDGKLYTRRDNGAASIVEIGAPAGLVSPAAAGLQPASGYGTISYASTITLDFAALAGQINTISLTGALTLATSNLANGRELRLRLICDGTQRTLTFPTDWKFVGPRPATIAASKVAILSAAAFGSANSDVIAAYSVQY